MRRLILPGIPFLLSFALSLSTAGAHCSWQDSGFFLVAVKDLGILYPPGFPLYVLLCKLWTIVLFFVDFTYAVHLFSAVCAAGTAGTLAVAARDLLRTKGPIFRTTEEAGPLAEWVGASIGCLAACGYTFWASAILAKVYAFYFLMLSLLIWRMIRADESGKPRDFTIVAALIGLSWQAHPSAALIGLALVLFVAVHRRVVGWKGVAWRSGLAFLCATGPIHLLPVFALREVMHLKFEDPSGVSGFLRFAAGTRFTASPGAFGIDASRAASVGRYFWEEFLGIGLLLVAAGGFRLWRIHRRLLIGLAAWVVPVLVVTVLFKIEGQHDFWMVAAWIPMWLLAAVGLSGVNKLREAAVVLTLAGVVWAVLANRSDLDRRHDLLPETLGRYYLQGVPKDSMLVAASDDAYALTLYLKRVRGEFPGTGVLAPWRDVASTSANYPGSPFYFEKPPSGVQELKVAGPLFRVPLARGSSVDWPEPVPAESIPALYRRPRGQFVERIDGRLHVRPEPYEKRLLRALLLARRNRAGLRAKEGKLAEAAPLYESILKLDPWMEEEASVVYPLAVVYAGLQRYGEAEAAFKKSLSLDLDPVKRAEACYFLTALCGARPEAAEWRRKALASPDLPQELRARLEGR